jgi:hypothetical protein
MNNGFELPEKLLADSQKSYDLKVFRWLRKTMIRKNIPENNKRNLSTSENIYKNMLSDQISEEKLRWLVDNGIKDTSTDWFFPNLDSLQAAVYIGGSGNIPFDRTCDPRREKF